MSFVARLLLETNRIRFEYRRQPPTTAASIARTVDSFAASGSPIRMAFEACASSHLSHSCPKGSPDDDHPWFVPHHHREGGRWGSSRYLARADGRPATASSRPCPAGRSSVPRFPGRRSSHDRPRAHGGSHRTEASIVPIGPRGRRAQPTSRPIDRACHPFPPGARCCGSASRAELPTSGGSSRPQAEPTRHSRRSHRPAAPRARGCIASHHRDSAQEPLGTCDWGHTELNRHAQARHPCCGENRSADSAVYGHPLGDGR